MLVNFKHCSRFLHPRPVVAAVCNVHERRKTEKEQEKEKVNPRLPACPDCQQTAVGETLVHPSTQCRRAGSAVWHSARTVPARCPHSAHTVPATVPAVNLHYFCALRIHEKEGFKDQIFALSQCAEVV